MRSVSSTGKWLGVLMPVLALLLSVGAGGARQEMPGMFAPLYQV